MEVKGPHDTVLQPLKPNLQVEKVVTLKSSSHSNLKFHAIFLIVKNMLVSAWQMLFIDNHSTLYIWSTNGQIP